MTRSSNALAALWAAAVLVGCGGGATVKPDRPATEPVVKPAPVKPAKPVAPEPQAAKAPNPTKDANGQFEDALAALKAKQLPTARAGFELLAKEHPEYSGPLTNLAILDAKADADAAAIANFNKAIAANPRNAVAHNWLGILYREAKNYSKAEQSYLQALSLNPDSAAVVLNLAILYDVYLKRPVDALTRYRDYQRMTNNRELKVAAWIKALETSSPPAVATPATPKT